MPERISSRSSSALPAARWTSSRGSRSSTSPPRSRSSSTWMSDSASGRRSSRSHEPLVQSLGHPIGNWLPGPQSRHDLSRSSAGQLPKNFRRVLIEQMCIVDDQQLWVPRCRRTRRRCRAGSRVFRRRARIGCSTLRLLAAAERPRARTVLPTPASPTTTVPTPSRSRSTIEVSS